MASPIFELARYLPDCHSDSGMNNELPPDTGTQPVAKRSHKSPPLGFRLLAIAIPSILGAILIIAILVKRDRLQID